MRKNGCQFDVPRERLRTGGKPLRLPSAAETRARSDDQTYNVDVRHHKVEKPSSTFRVCLLRLTSIGSDAHAAQLSVTEIYYRGCEMNGRIRRRFRARLTNFEWYVEHYRGPLTDGNKRHGTWRSGTTTTVMQYSRFVLHGRKGVVLHNRGGHIIYFVQTGPVCWLVSAPLAVARRAHVVC